jgi:hypothetical protein
MIIQDKKNIVGQRRHGYILVITITLLSLAVVIVTRLADDSVLNNSYVVDSYKRLKAQQLAFSGIDLGRSIIAPKEDDPKKAKQFKEILLKLNRWQNYEIKLKDDSGLKCNLKFYLSSEQSKCNINKCLQFAKNEKSQKLEPNVWEIIAEPLGKILNTQDLKSATDEWAAKRPMPLNDTTDLLRFEKFAYFKDKIVLDEKMEYALDDIFTISTNDDKIQPYLLSNSMAKFLKFKNINDFTTEEWQELVNKAAEKFNENISIERDWDELFAPMFGKKISELPTNFLKTCSPKWDPKIFSIIVHVHYDNVFYALCAIISAEKMHRLYFI